MTTGIRRDQIRGFEIRAGEIGSGELDPALFGTSTTTIDPDDATSHGVTNAFSRTDHQHQFTTAAAGAIAPDDTAAEGSAATMARSDHRHSITAAAPITISRQTSNAEGAGTDFARATHQHQLAGLQAWCSNARFTRNTSQNISNDTDTYISWNNQEEDTDNWLTPTSDTLTVPFAGLVEVVANVRWQAETSGRRQVRIHYTPSGGSVTTIAEQANDGVDAEVTRQSVSSGWLTVAANDTFKIEVHQVSALTLTVGSGSVPDTNVSVLLIRMS